MGKSRIPVVHNKKIISAADNVLTISFVKYLLVGFSSFFLEIFLFAILDRFTPIIDLAANITASTITLVFNFTFSNRWTFKAGKANPTKIKRYAMLAVFNYIFNNVTFQIVSVQLGVNGILTKVLITAAIVCWNFFLYKLWVFKGKSTSQM